MLHTGCIRTCMRRQSTRCCNLARAIADAELRAHVRLRKVLVQQGEVVAQGPEAGLADVVHIEVACHSHDASELGGLTEAQRQGAHEWQRRHRIAHIDAKLADWVKLQQQLRKHQ